MRHPAPAVKMRRRERRTAQPPLGDRAVRAHEPETTVCVALLARVRAASRRRSARRRWPLPARGRELPRPLPNRPHRFQSSLFGRGNCRNLQGKRSFQILPAQLKKPWQVRGFVVLSLRVGPRGRETHRRSPHVDRLRRPMSRSVVVFEAPLDALGPRRPRVQATTRTNRGASKSKGSSVALSGLRLHGGGSARRNSR